MNQLYSSNSLSSFLVIAEPDIRIISEIANGLASGRVNTLLPFPDLRGKLLDPNLFANAILNFSPKDLQSIAAVRKDKLVRRYAGVIQSELAKHPADVQNDTLNEALIESYRKSETDRRTAKLFEIGTWVVKPLHYIPIAGEILTAAEDVKDVVQSLSKAKETRDEWYMIGVRMHEVSVKDYMMRISNRYPAARG
jgi:hypothetical protein